MSTASDTQRVLDTWDEFATQGTLLKSLSDLESYLGRTEKGRIQTVNLQHVFVASQSLTSHQDLEAATAVTADGWPLQWYTERLLKTPIERVTGRQALDLLIEGRTNHERVATIGGSKSTGDALNIALKAAGKELVYRNESVISDADSAQLIDELANARPDLILTALGSPRGERLGRLIHERADIKAIVIGVGGAIEMWSGKTPAAPLWAQSIRCEWLYRLLREPRRLFRRYVFECVPVMATMLKRVGHARRKQR